ncbi:hypothetical protein [Salinispora arenicola]|uniref:hypothetical protein n=1 Tax=Salinispora arenicola TaxID=168697 RepID=UPI000379FB0A|nr:hypothetical protein [Salinispora arenicola]
MTEPASGLNRRAALRGGAVLAVAAASLGGVEPVARVPRRVPEPTTGAGLPDIQFDVAAYCAPEQVSPTGGPYVMLPVHTCYLTARLLRTPTVADQRELAGALTALEERHPFGAAGLMTVVGYGLPYFRRLPGGLSGELVGAAMPRLADNPDRYVLEEAVPAPTDVHQDHPGVRKLRYQVPVRIEENDLLLTLRGDRAGGDPGRAGLVAGQRPAGRCGGALPGLRRAAGVHLQPAPDRPERTARTMAEQNQPPYARFIQPESPLWMGFSDQQVDASGPPAICTFAGHPSARSTSARLGDYFDNDSVQHLSHVILDLLQFYDMADAATPPSENGAFRQRVQ